MQLETKEFVPENYTLIRRGWFCWTWRYEDHLEVYISEFNFLTAGKAIKNANRHWDLMQEEFPELK